ncbi:hypothetical protein TNCV_514641 [Trichonephila clavipes]|nr:hypothetical protein TNCV_514641 [Trichonephila clavipes]
MGSDLRQSGFGPLRTLPPAMRGCGGVRYATGQGVYAAKKFGNLCSKVLPLSPECGGSLVYADKPQTLDHLEDNIRRVIADIRPQMLEKIDRKLDVQIGLHPSQPWQSYARNHI